MPWTPHNTAPIVQFAAAPRSPALRVFAGKPHALAFLADGSLVVGSSQGITLHDPAAPSPPRAAVEGIGGVEWMVAHPDGESVVAAVREPRGRAVVRVWPGSGRVVSLVPAPIPGYQFCGALAPDGARVYWRRSGPAPVLYTVDALTGAVLRELELPQEANRAGALAVRRDGAVYMQGNKMLVVHPDGRAEPRADSPFFMAPEPLFVADDGGLVGTRGERVGFKDGAFVHAREVGSSARTGTIAHDRSRLTFHGGLGDVQVWDVAAESPVFAVTQPSTIGTHPGWRGQAAASSASHVAAIDFRDAGVTIWQMDRPEQPSARLMGYSRGLRRVMVHGGALTVQHTQSSNYIDSVQEIELASGATRMLARTLVHDVARTRDGQRLLVLHEQGPSMPLVVAVLDAAGEALESVEVQRAAGEVTVAPGGATWGVISHSYPAQLRAEPTCHGQWRAFGATKWAKNVKLKGRFPRLALADTAAAVMADEQLEVVGIPKGKSLLSTPIAKGGRGVALSPDGAFAAVASFAGPRLVRVATGAVTELTPELPGERSSAISLCFTDEWLFVGYDSGAITQHRVPGGEQVAALHGHTDEVLALTWADGALWSASEDGTVVRWGELG
ncbi:hypothetical protein OV203_06230 [Nannocystis sp. ILAH1]|uniref:hypothetical protein n=1 Tax=unclassified Nannocystis TaxID=2627009 RepID=UPI0022704BF4|nr:MULTISPECIES: hypothetical protein [unclassified Nannocystis]MCY0986708.1 hypothetical protein [Nannocystis sp. ILAH1]MCY1071587.1 hypothetical protein [Nannocystis sp. RBIL2]